MDEELKLCPFCGSEASIINGGFGRVFVNCDGCNTSTDDGTKERAIAVWNRRVPDPRIALAVEALENALAAGLPDIVAEHARFTLSALRGEGNG